MMVDTHSPSAVAERIRDLCRQFKLPTLAAETVGKFSEAGYSDALVTLVEVLEQGGRGQACQAGGPSEKGVEAASGQDLGDLRAR